jgi:hypothetical protein
MQCRRGPRSARLTRPRRRQESPDTYTDGDTPHARFPRRRPPRPTQGSRRRRRRPRPSLRRCRAGPGRLADPAGLVRRSLPRRRRHRRLRAAAHRGADALARPPGDHRQPRRRRRHGRRGHRRQVGARRLHLLHGRGPPHDRAVDVSQARLLARERLRPARPDRERAAGRRRQPAARRLDRPEELPRLRAQEPGQAQLRLGRQRHLAPPRRRAVQDPEQDLHHAHPVPRRRPGAAGPDHRPGRLHVRRPRLVLGAHQERPDPALGTASQKRAPASPTCRRAPSRACRTTRSPPGTACGRPKARRRRSSSGWRPRCRRHSPPTS